MSGTTLTREEVQQQIDELRAALVQLEATQVTSTPPQTCGRATLAGTPCSRPATVGPTCSQHTPARITARDLRVSRAAQQRAEFLADRAADAAERATQVRAQVGQQGGFVVVVRHRGTVTRECLSDLRALRPSGSTDELHAHMSAQDVVAVAHSWGLSTSTVSATTGEPVVLV